MPFHSLRLKINAAIIVTCLFVVLCFSAIVFPYEIRQRASRFDEIRTLVSAVFEQRREEIANEIYARQQSALASSLNSLTEVKGISKVMVYATDGKLIAATEPGAEPNAGGPGSLDRGPGMRRSLVSGHPYAVYSAPVEVIGVKVGYINIYYDLRPSHQEALYTTGMFILLLVSILVAIPLLLNVLLNRFVLGPTFMLRNAITRLQGGNLGEQVPLVSQDEIGEVAAAFNEMSSMLGSQHEALNDSLKAQETYSQMLENANRDLAHLNASLESMVQERTFELTESNRRLLEEITEKIRAEEARRELEERLARSQKMEALGLLAGGVGHDLNNVLSGVVSYPDFLLMGMPEDHPLRKAMTTIRNSGLKAAAIVQDLLALARRGVMQTCVLDFNLDIVQDYLDSPEYASLLAQHPGIRVESRLDQKLRKIKGSPVHLRKSLMNLVINAAEAQPQGGAIRLSTSNAYLDAPMAGCGKVPEGEYIMLRVEDDGVGIKPEDLERIFEPFYTRKVMGRSGTGLGMAVVWGTIQDHHGCITVHSVQGQGSTFDLFFPATREEGLLAERGQVPTAEYRGRGEHILVVDDLEDQRTLVSAILRKLNYRVDTAASGEAAVEYLRTRTVDLVLLDMIMDPGMDGLATYREIIRLHPGQKAIIASGFAENERVVEAIALGVSRYLKKPYTIENLGKALRSELIQVPQGDH
jgi:signal transduction histidine kinase/ActR/RegA family two-component response regulator/HAMP domain-containing protein